VGSGSERCGRAPAVKKNVRHEPVHEHPPASGDRALPSAEEACAPLAMEQRTKTCSLLRLRPSILKLSGSPNLAIEPRLATEPSLPSPSSASRRIADRDRPAGVQDRRAVMRVTATGHSATSLFASEEDRRRRGGGRTHGRPGCRPGVAPLRRVLPLQTSVFLFLI